MANCLDQVITDRYAIYNADSMEVMADMPDKSIDASIYSPPFTGLYHYSSSDRDLSNAPTRDDFFNVYEMFVKEIFRLTKPGRLTGVHASPIPSSNTGIDTLYDLPGDIIRTHERAGWKWIARHVIWKEPLTVRNRTMAKNLSHRTTTINCEHAGIAIADELLIFRKGGKCEVPVVHETGFLNYYGGIPVPPEYESYRGWTGDQKQNKYSHTIWRRYASSIWDDIRPGRVTPFRDSKDPDDEKHVHPLQLDIIARFVDMRTNKNETVFTPFMGVGSEVYESVRLGRKAIGAELKPSYFKQAVKNLEMVEADETDMVGNQIEFDFMGGGNLDDHL